VIARTRTSEAGFTLVELLVAVSLMGLIMTALTSAVIVGFRSTRDTHTSLDQSNAEQIITTYVTKDIQAANAVVAPVTLCGGETPKLELTTRSGPRVTDSLVNVRYALRTNGELLRCKDGISSTIAHDVTDFTVSGTDTVATTVTTAASTEVPAYQFSFEVRRRQAPAPAPQQISQRRQVGRAGRRRGRNPPHGNRGGIRGPGTKGAILVQAHS
jgi:prepilin-type N-terminal cleavage/methylation domain-containing protein